MADTVKKTGGTRTPAKATRPASGRSRRKQADLPDNAGERFLITDVTPEIDAGRYPAKRVAGDWLEVFADIVCDGHVQVAAQLRYREAGASAWRAEPMRLWDNDRWTGRCHLTRNTRYEYTIDAWVDEFATWRRDTLKKVAANQDIAVDVAEGMAMVEAAAATADGADRLALGDLLSRAKSLDVAGQAEALLGDRAAEVMARAGARLGLTSYWRTLEVVVDPPQARFAAWYEMFWRSQGTDPDRGATIDECIDRLGYIRDLGFDVVYLVPIHPIGRTNRKGKNNTLNAGPDDPGSPYAIGSEEGGHTAVNPEWGTLEDFRRFVAAAADHGLAVALDFAIQCSPDHSWIKEHKDWFRWRPDGSIKFAENPPKKYEDIVNVEFYQPHSEAPIEPLWRELRDVVLFWVEQGVKIFRVDNPHTKPLPFWEWLIRDVQDKHPDTAFLAEAFTRPKVMKGLAKIGFTQSYSYFTWRTGKAELTDYLEELTQGPARDYMRANFFTNTPDINPVILQVGGRPAFLQRIVLAATLSSVYGMYNGYELCEGTPVPGKEEFLNSEKYQYKVWDWDRPGNIKDWVARLNQIRRENPALHQYDNLKFYNIWNDNLLLYGKMTENRSNNILVAVNLDPYSAHEGSFELPLWELGLPDWASVEMEDLFTGAKFTWTGKQQHLWIDNQRPAFIWRMTPR